MKRNTLQAFTLVEMLTVMLIIAIVSGLVVGVASLANKKAAIERTQGEIQAISSAIGQYKSDFGSAPRAAGTTEQDPSGANGGAPPIDPRSDGNPLLPKYQLSSQFLYQQLSGDADLDGKPGDNGAKVYYEFKPAMLAGLVNGNGAGGAGTVSYLQDPYGLCYGYSTAGAAYEDQYRKLAEAAAPQAGSGSGSDVYAAQVDRTTLQSYGYNATFDLWSTAGQQTTPPTDLVRQKWVKNW